MPILNDEARMPNDEGMSKAQNERKSDRTFFPFGFRHCFGLRHSGFVILSCLTSMQTQLSWKKTRYRRCDRSSDRCIGDHFTMGPIRAADAVQLVGPKMAIPMHSGTFPALTGTPDAFGRELKKCSLKTELRVMNEGETITV